MNSTVTATNMQITATTSNNLMISLNPTDGYTSSVDMDKTGSNMRPASTIGGNTPTPVFWIISSVGNGMTQDSYARSASTTMGTAADTDYVKQTVFVKNIGANASDLIATVTKTSATTKELDKSIRVMLVVKNGETYTSFIYSPVAGAAYGTEGQAVARKDGTNHAVLEDIKTAAVSGTTKILDTLTKDTAYQVDIYAWYEGEDINCKATNTLDMAFYQFTVEFTATPITSA